MLETKGIKASMIEFNMEGEVQKGASIIEEIEYETVVEGEAYARGKNNKWFWTTVVTPGEENFRA